MTITERLRQLSIAVADQNWREFSMRVPAEPDHDADIVIMKAAMLIESRDAEVVSLTNQRDYEYVRAENAEQERDQLREQISSLKDELRQISTAVDDIRLDLTNTAAELIMEMKEQLAERDAEVTDLLKQNVMLCMYLSQIAWGNTAKQQSAWAEEALNKTKELSKLILCSKDHVAITKNDSEVEFFHIVPQKTLLYRAITDIRKVL